MAAYFLNEGCSTGIIPNAISMYCNDVHWFCVELDWAEFENANNISNTFHLLGESGCFPTSHAAARPVQKPWNPYWKMVVFVFGLISMAIAWLKLLLDLLWFWSRMHMFGYNLRLLSFYIFINLIWCASPH